jgi:hypothetical protein
MLCSLGPAGYPDTYLDIIMLISCLSRTRCDDVRTILSKADTQIIALGADLIKSEA